MPQYFKRQELYDLVWSTPMRELAKDYNISDRGLAKACARADIPVPERGYWAKLQAGKKVSQRSLPPRGLGMDDEIQIGGHSWYGYNSPSDQEILNSPIPPVPEFEEELQAVRARAEQMVSKVKLPKTLQNPHRFVAKLLVQDDERQKKKLESRYPSIFDDPWFDSPFEQRRLKIISALYTALENCGFQPSSTRKEGRDLGVKIGDYNVGFTLDDITAKDDQSYLWLARDKKPSSTRMRLRVSGYKLPEDIRQIWDDVDGDKIENHLPEIAAELIVAGEVFYRATKLHRHQWRVERKAELEQKELERIEEEARQAEERRIRNEQARIDHLLAQAGALKQATEIRAYVQAILEANNSAPDPMNEEELRSWEEWALAQADRIDPVKSGAYKTFPETGE
jgi:hypothetical protein